MIGLTGAIILGFALGWTINWLRELRRDVRGLARRMADLEATTYGDGK
jgi:hypothetical protein